MWNQELRYYISLAITAQPSRKRDLPHFQPNCLDAHIQQRAYPILLRPPIAQTKVEVVQEYQPVVHRLRFSASA